MRTVEGFVRAVAWRLGAEALLGRMALWLCGGLATASLLVLAQRLLSLDAPGGLGVLVPLAAASSVGLVLSLRHWPDRVVAALQADARFGLDERVTSALFAGQGAIADLARSDAARRVAAIHVPSALPIRWPRATHALVLLAGLLAVALFVPPLDLLGLARSRRERAAEVEAVREAARAARAALGPLGETARKRGFQDAADAVKAVDGALDPAAQGGAGAAEARSVLAKAEAELAAAGQANEDARRAAPGDLEKQERLDQAKDVLVAASRAVARFGRELPAGSERGARGAAAGQGTDEKGAGVPAAVPSPFVRAPEAPPEPSPISSLETRLIEARAGADSALAREGTAWRYRAVVRRYFSDE